VLGNGPGDEDGVTILRRRGQPAVGAEGGVGLSDRVSDAEFRREWERYYLRSVRAGAALIYRGRRPRILDLDLAPGSGRRRRS
jgi:hypothetical protein